MHILFEPLHAGVTPPSRATAQSAGYDLRADIKNRKITLRSATNHETTQTFGPSLSLMPGDRAIVPLGFKATLPDGYEAQIRPRSGAAFKVGLCVLNAPGTIDADYPLEWGVLVENRSETFLVIDHDERIAQAVFAKYEVLEFTPGTVGQTTERTGGHGSTGR